MPRKAREQLNDGYAHILVQGMGREHVFPFETNKQYYIGLINEIKDKFGIGVLAYRVLDTHAHLLVKAGSGEGLAQFMHRLNMRYAAHYNRESGRSGCVFRERFKSQTLNEEDIGACARFVQENAAARREAPGSGVRFLEHDDRVYEKFDDVLAELKRKYNIQGKNSLKYAAVLRSVVAQLQNRTGASLRVIAKRLDIDRERVRRSVSNAPSDCARSRLVDSSGRELFSVWRAEQGEQVKNE